MLRFKSLFYFLSVCLGIIFILPISSVFAFASEKPEIFVQLGHSKEVQSVSFSPDGHYLVSAGQDKTVKLWDMATSREMRTFRHEETVGSAAFSPDGRHILSGDWDGKMRLWDIKTGKIIMSLAHPSMVVTVAFSSDGKYALSAGGNALVYWDIKRGELIFNVESTGNTVWAAAFSKDGKYIVMCIESYGVPDTINIIDVKKKIILKTFPAAEGRIRAVAFSPDGKSIISGSGDNKKDSQLRVWNAASGELKKTFSFRLPVQSVAFSPDGKYAAAGTYEEVAIFEVATWEKKRTIKGVKDAQLVVFSPDSRFLAYTNNREYIHGVESHIVGIEIVDMASGERIRRLSRDAEQVRSAAFSSTRHEIIASGIRLSHWDMNIGKRARATFLKDSSGKAVILDAVSPDAKYAIEYYLDNDIRGIRLWDISTEKMVHQFPKGGTSVELVRFSHDGRYLLTGSWDGELAIWDLYNRRKVNTFLGKHRERVTSLAFSPDGKFAFSGSVSDDGTIKMWDVATGSEVKTFTEAKAVTSLDVSPDGKYLLSGGYSGKEFPVILWNIDTGLKVKTFKGHAYIVNTVAFSHDGKYALSGDFDHAIKLWDITAGKEVKTFNGHSGLIESVGFSQDDKRLISVSRDGTTRLWDVSSGKELAQFVNFTDGEWIVITPEGYFNASSGGAKHLNVSVGNNVYSIDNFYEKFFKPVYVASVLQGKKMEAVADIRKGILSPPDVRITSPAPGKEFSTDTLTVTVAAKDTGGGIDGIRLYHNGKAIGEDQRGLKLVSKGGETVKDYTVTLVDGINTFRAVGFSKDRTESNPYELVVKLTAPSKDVSLYVFAVGINKYKNPALNLNYAEPDARGIADFFKQQGKRLFKNVDIRVIYNEHATKENIVSKLSQLQNINLQDVVLIYLAGHGENINDKWYFIPHELTYPEREEDVKTKGISSDELSGYMKNIKAQKILVLIDACKSGAVLVAFRGFEDRKALSQLSRSTGVHIIAASTKDQFAAEVKDLGHGVFTYTLLEGLKGKAAGGGETVTVFKLKAYLDEQLPEITKKYKQEAQYPVGDTRGMDFPLVIVK
jgi:WD40 repeat protein